MRCVVSAASDRVDPAGVEGSGLFGNVRSLEVSLREVEVVVNMGTAMEIASRQGLA